MCYCGVSVVVSALAVAVVVTVCELEFETSGLRNELFWSKPLLISTSFTNSSLSVLSLLLELEVELLRSFVPVLLV